MKLILHNIAKVVQANITLSGITVIAGPNKSGKSTIGRILMTYGTLLRRMDEFVRNRKLRIFFARLCERLGLTELFQYRFRRLIFSNYQADDILSPDFWNDRERVKNLFSQLSRLMPPSRFHSLNQEIESLNQTEISELLLDVLGQNDQEIMRDIIEERFREVFSGQINSLQQPSTEAFVSLSGESNGQEGALWLGFKDGHLMRHSDKMVDAFPKILYLEPLHILDLLSGGFPEDRLLLFGDRYHAGDCGWDEIMEGKTERGDDFSLAEKQQLTLLLDEIRKILGGELALHDGRQQFREHFLSSQNAWVEIDNLASGMKSLVALSQALRNHVLRRGMVFVIDEPESNLHPDWQIKFASVLAKLWKILGVRVLVATHSPYFLKGMEISSAQIGCLDDLSCYMMRLDKNGFGTVSDDITGELNEVYKTFFDPLNELLS